MPQLYWTLLTVRGVVNIHDVSDHSSGNGCRYTDIFYL